jgi:hypothetical protein
LVALEFDDLHRKRVKIFKCIDVLDTYLRGLIQVKLKEKFGDEWLKMIPKPIRAYWEALDTYFTSGQLLTEPYYPDFKDYELIISENWETFAPFFKGLDRDKVIKALRKLRRKRRLSHHASPHISEIDVEETIFLTRMLLDDNGKKELEKVLKGQKLTNTEIKVIGPLVFQLNGVSSAEELAKITGLPIHIVTMVLRESFIRMGLISMATGAEIRSGMIAGAPILEAENRFKTQEEIYFLTLPIEEVLRRYPELKIKDRNYG